MLTLDNNRILEYSPSSLQFATPKGREICTACWERRKRVRRAYRAGLCLACWRGDEDARLDKLEFRMKVAVAMRKVCASPAHRKRNSRMRRAEWANRTKRRRNGRTSAAVASN